jgi:hypothetical protein
LTRPSITAKKGNMSSPASLPFDACAAFAISGGGAAGSRPSSPRPSVSA